MTHLVVKMTKNWQITLSYMLVLITGFLLDNSIWSATNILANLKLLCEVLFPLATLIIACIGLQSWKKAERFKIKYKLAIEVLEKVKEQNNQCIKATVELNILLDKKERFVKGGTLKRSEFLTDGVTSQFRSLDDQHRLLAEAYRNYFDELYILDEELLKKVNLFLIFNQPLSNLHIEVNFKTQPTQQLDVWIARLRTQCDHRTSIYKHLLEIAAS